jgi:site-specific DNA-methyltransferase (adenine-specific)
VLDCFAGSGTTGVAAHLLGRNAISIEREADFIEMIKARQAKAEAKRKG